MVTDINLRKSLNLSVHFIFDVIADKAYTNFGPNISN